MIDEPVESDSDLVESDGCESQEDLNAQVVEIENTREEESFVELEQNDPDHVNFETKVVELYEDLNNDFLGIVTKVRRIVRKFRESPKNRRFLRKYTELSVPIDCKTRWTSLNQMLARFIKIFDQLQKACIDAKIKFDVSLGEKQILESLIHCLDKVTEAINTLSNRKANLNTCDLAISKLLQGLDERETDMCKEFKSSILQRYLSRRTKYSDFLSYLLQHNVDQSDNLFKPTQQIDFDELEQLYLDLGLTFEQEENDVEEVDDAIDASMNIDLSSKKKRPKKGLTFAEMIRSYEATGELPTRLQEFAEALMTIRPTSTETERTFSLAKLILAPLRNRMKIDMASDIVVLNRFYAI